jgi:hypothetical protein
VDDTPGVELSPAAEAMTVNLAPLERGGRTPEM